MKTVALIPARGGSKGIPCKNIKDFNGKPLIEHSIDQALSSLEIDEVWVSTDCETIKMISEAAGAKVLMRPDEFATDEASTEVVIEHFLKNVACDTIVLIQCTSPLRPKCIFDEALETFNEQSIIDGIDSLVSVSKSHRFNWKFKKDSFDCDYDRFNRPRRQDIKVPTFVETGSFYIFSRSIFEFTGSRLGGDVGYHIMDEKYSYEIDTMEDFIMLEALARRC